MILGLAVGKIRYIYEVMEELWESVGFEKSYLSSLIKMLGIAYMGNFLQECPEMPGIRQQPDRLSCFAGFQSWY